MTTLTSGICMCGTENQNEIMHTPKNALFSVLFWLIVVLGQFFSKNNFSHSYKVMDVCSEETLSQ
jgi:hypothetical protein